MVVARMHLFIIDAASPFFAHQPDRTSRINWSKIPYDSLERDGKLPKKRYQRIRSDFYRYIDTVQSVGYNAISFDDVAHMVPLLLYTTQLRKKISKYRRRITKLLRYCVDKNIDIFINTDIVFSNREIRAYVGGSQFRLQKLLLIVMRQLFEQNREISGVILRFGEADGVDTSGDFSSDLFIRTPQQLNQLLRCVYYLYLNSTINY